MARLRVAIDCRPAAAKTSGVGRYIQNLVVGLAERGQFSLLLLVRQDLHASLHDLPNTTLITLDDGADAAWFPHRLRWEQSALAGYLRHSRADLFHATWNFGVPWNSPCPAVLTLHDLLPIEFPGDFGSRQARFAYYVGQYLALARARRIISVSGATLAALRRHARFAYSKATVVHHGIEPMFSPEPRSAEHPYILYVGGFGMRKNVNNLFTAYDRLARQSATLPPLWLTGLRDGLEGESAAVFNGLARATQENIRFLGAIADENMPDLYRRAALLVFPTRGEGFGLPALEALACGTAVVTSSAGSIPEVVGEHACFIDPLVPASIADGITKVLNDRSYRERLIEGGLRHASGFRWDNAVTATAAVYSSALGSLR